MTMRLLVGRLTPAIRAKSVTPCGGRATRRGAAAVHRFQCHLEKATNVNGQRLPCLCGPASLLNLRLDILRLINGFRELSSTSAGDFLHKSCLPEPSRPPGPSDPQPSLAQSKCPRGPRAAGTDFFPVSALIWRSFRPRRGL